MNNTTRFKRLLVALLALTFGTAQGAPAQSMGGTLSSFNILANQAVTLTGFGAQPLVVDRVGTSPGVTLTTTDARATHYHANDLTAVNGQAEAAALWNDLLAPAGATVTAIPLNTLDPAYLVGGGVTVFTRAGDITETGTVTITGTASSVIIFQVQTSVTFTNFDILLAGGILPSNVYWRVGTAVTITNNDATTRSVPGTFLNNTAAQNMTVTASGAGGLNVGRFASIQGSVSVTQSGAGSLLFNTPANGGDVGYPRCTDGYFFPSPATGPTGTFAYCMAGPGTVRIRVYNAIGDLASKIEDYKQGGSQTSTMNTGRLAPGVYLYTLERDYGTHRDQSRVKKFAVRH